MTGKVVHFEVPYDDADRARGFYKDVFGWQIQELPEMGYNLVSTGPTSDQGMPTEAGYIGGGMLQREEPGDYVVATGETHSVREFLQEAFSYAGLDWNQYVVVDPKYFRPAEVDFLLGDPTKARTVLGWTPKVDFKQLVRIMVDADMEGDGLPVRPRG